MLFLRVAVAGLLVGVVVVPGLVLAVATGQVQVLRDHEKESALEMAAGHLDSVAVKQEYF